MHLYVCVYTCTCAYLGGETHTLKKSHFVVIHIYIYIFIYLNLYTCTRLCLYLYVGVFRWRNAHLEQITFCHYPLIYIYTHTLEPVYSYTFVSIFVYGVFRWRNPLLEQITFCRYPYLFIYIHTYIQTDIHTYRLEPICIYTFMSILVYVRI